MYSFKEELNCENYFRFEKVIIRENIWAKLPQASKAIYPVIGVHCNVKGVAFPSELTIAILSGCTEKTVREGQKGLMGLRGFRIERYITNRGKRAIKYRINPPPMRKGQVFFFHKAVVEGGNWLHLTPTAQALYPVLRTFSFFDYYEYMDRECDEPDYDEECEIFKNRKYDLVNADIQVMAEFAGISIKSIPPAMESLKDNFLIEETEPVDGDYSPTWKLFLIPPKYFLRDWLNQKTAKRYGKVRKEKITP